MSFSRRITADFGQRRALGGTSSDRRRSGRPGCGYGVAAEADKTNSSGTPAEAFLADLSTNVHTLLREITIFEKTITSVTAPQMAKNVLEAIFPSRPPCLSPRFRGNEVMGPPFRRRLNASVCEHFTLNKSRISCAQRSIKFMMRSNQGQAHTGVATETAVRTTQIVMVRYAFD